MKRKSYVHSNNCYYYQVAFIFLSLFLFLLSKINTTNDLLISNHYFLTRINKQDCSEDLFSNSETTSGDRTWSKVIHHDFGAEKYFYIEKYVTADNRFQFFRLNNACTLRNGKILLDTSWENDEKWIRQECHITSLDYMDRFNYKTQHHGFFDFDLLGAVSILRLQGRNILHQPHFVERFLHAYFAADILHNLSSQALLDFQCRLPQRKKCSPGSVHIYYPFNISIIVPSNVLLMSKSDWIPQFLNMLPGSATVIPSCTFTKLDFQCFKSIILFPPRIPILHDFSFPVQRSENNVYFQNRSDQEHSEMFPMHNCNVRIVIINRNTTRNRNFINLREMEIAVREKLTASRLILLNMNWTLHITEFENKSFSEQKQDMNLADIIIGPHGAGLTNIIFAKRGTPVLEVFPYLYYYNLFQQFARTLSLNYSYSVAAPDSKSFLKCVNGKASHSSNPNLLADARRIWKKVEQVYNADPTSFKKQKVSHSCSDGLKIRHFVRDQSLYVNVSHIAQWVLESVKLICWWNDRFTEIEKGKVEINSRSFTFKHYLWNRVPSFKMVSLKHSNFHY